MKYRLINPEVFAVKITHENRLQYTSRPQDSLEFPVGSFVVTFPDGHVENMTQGDFVAKYRPALLTDARREMIRLCNQIVDQETMEDGENAPTLLANAVELAKELRKLIQ